jgi:hypothetical protein
VSPRFRRLLKGVSKGEVLVPLIRDALEAADFPAFTIEVSPPTERPPDGWFHPSTHPMMAERVLSYYLKGQWTREDRMAESTIALIQGTFWHEFIAHVGAHAGVFERTEVYVEDKATRARGRFDWFVRLSSSQEPEVGELKTMRSRKIDLFPSGAPDDEVVVESFMERFPTYYAQAQEYMRLSGLRRWRGVFVGLEYPFSMQEVALAYDPRFAARTRDKYLRVLEASKEGRDLPFCCTGGATAQACGARGACPMGSIN